ncbi:MAG: aldo/keto reductase [Alphaproteobacteria bacterium]|jgi:aryl-alcohol dehydrogenase-like predicted oxidoreductase|nr:aldo/keto reductase [Alphaproteobacteria bacterium]
MQLALGTVQFGLDYGISNSHGKCLPAEAEKIVGQAIKAGVSVIDTAPTYGESEEVLGKILPTDHSFNIVTKTPSFAAASSPPMAADLVEETLINSLTRLKSDKIYGILVHLADELFSDLGQAVFDRLGSLRDQGIVRKIGVSVYSAEHIDRLVPKFPIQVVQAPVNIFDQRLVINGQLNRLKELGIEFHARSIFLQGLLLMKLKNDLPDHLIPLEPALARFHKDHGVIGMTEVEAAVGFISQLSEVDHAVVGVTSVAEFDQVAAAAQGNFDVSLEWPSYAETSDFLLDPSQWPKPKLNS